MRNVRDVRLVLICPSHHLRFRTVFTEMRDGGGRVREGVGERGWG